MTLFFNPFSRSQGGNAWFRAGLASSFPNITGEDDDNIAHIRSCGDGADTKPGCKVFYVPKEDSSRANEVALDDSGTPSEAGSLRDQVLVFQYKAKFYAINQASGTIPAQILQTAPQYTPRLTEHAGVSAFIVSPLRWDAFRH
ncbi:hypothetical protein Daus18300_012655 [Diaporthe australafricana]|uniref:Uncharacterized protein n=1 Tax=Diaporthe australafricana TaxID=127596 RepID=A0ABR3W226_9PEZI